MNKRFLTYGFLLLCSFGQAQSWTLKPWSQDIGLDLGTRNSVAVTNEAGKVKVISNTPSAVAYYRDSGKLICIGQQALAKVGKSPESVIACRPMKDGVINDLKATNALINGMFKGAGFKMGALTKTRIVIGIPCTVKAGDQIAIRECVKKLGASDILIVKEPIAAAINSGLDIGGDEAHMVIDIGGGTTDIIVIAQHEALSEESITVAGDAMDRAIVDYVRERFQLSIDEETAQQIKVEIGAVYIETDDQNRKMDVSGMDLLQQKPRKIVLSTKDVIEALRPCAEAILNAAHGVVRELSDRAAGDIARNGILLVGGGAMVFGMKELFEERFGGLSVVVPLEPLLAIGMGIGKILGDFENYKNVIKNTANNF